MRLSTLYQAMSTQEREELATKLDSEVGYLWQLATRWRGKRASIDFMKKLAAADSRLTLTDMVEEFAEEPPAQPVVAAKA